MQNARFIALLGVIVVVGIFGGRTLGAGVGMNSDSGCGGPEGVDEGLTTLHSSQAIEHQIGSLSATRIATRSSMTRFFELYRIPDEADDEEPHYSLSLAGREAESFQILLNTPAEIDEVTVSFSDFQASDGSVLPKDSISWFEVGYVFVPGFEGHLGYADDGSRKLDADGEPHPAYRTHRRPNPGWYPDPLLPRKEGDTILLRAGKTHSIWVTAAAPANSAGTYEGKAILEADDEMREIAITIRVYDFNLPQRASLDNAFGLWKNKIDAVYQDEAAGQYRKWMKFMVQHRVSPNYPMKGPGKVRTKTIDGVEDPVQYVDEADIDGAENKDELPIAHYKAIQDEVTSFAAHKISYTWRARHADYVDHQRPVALHVKWFENQISRARGKRAQAMLRKFAQADFLKEYAVDGAHLGGFIYSLDEANKESLKNTQREENGMLPVDHFADLRAIHGYIKSHSRYGKYPIVVTTNMLKGHRKKLTPSDPPLSGREILGASRDFERLRADVLVANLERWDRGLVKRLNRKQKKHWGYITFRPLDKRPNWRLDNPPMEARALLGPLAFRDGYDGFLFWGVNAWSHADYLPNANDPNRPTMPATRKGTPALIDEYGGLRLNTNIRNPVYGWVVGGGILTYPGQEGPIGSIRFVNIRDGLEDHDYLRELRRRRDSHVGKFASDGAMRRAKAIAPSIWSLPKDPNAYYEWRQNLAKAILDAE